MLLISAVAIGLLAGLAVGGRADRLGDVRIAWAWPALAGLLLQVALFTDAGSSAAGPALPYLYVGSTLLVFVALLRNVRLPGVPLVALGAASNLAAIVANGGYMPVSPDALAAIGRAGSSGIHANTVVAAGGAPLTWLGDIIAVPPPVPAANVVSIGDVLIALGAIVFLVLAMRGRVAVSAASGSSPDNDALGTGDRAMDAEAGGSTDPGRGDQDPGTRAGSPASRLLIDSAPGPASHG